MDKKKFTLRLIENNDLGLLCEDGESIIGLEPLEKDTGVYIINRLNSMDDENHQLSKLNKILEGFLLSEGYSFTDIIKFLHRRIKE